MSSGRVDDGGAHHNLQILRTVFNFSNVSKNQKLACASVITTTWALHAAQHFNAYYMLSITLGVSPITLTSTNAPQSIFHTRVSLNSHRASRVTDWLRQHNWNVNVKCKNLKVKRSCWPAARRRSHEIRPKCVTCLLQRVCIVWNVHVAPFNCT